MTDFKVGDKVRAIRKAKAPYTDIEVLKGEVLTFVSDSCSAYGEPWVRVKHPLARGGEVYFEAKDFETMEKLREMDKKPPSKASPPGWTFRATPADFDGPRILRELEAQGAQYAVIVWGKGQAERIAVISQDLDERSDAHAKAKPGPSVLFSSTQALQDFGPGKAVIHSSSEWGWHEVTLPDESPARLKDLKALAGRVEAWERVNAKVRVYVAYGPAGGK